MHAPFPSFPSFPPSPRYATADHAATHAYWCQEAAGCPCTRPRRQRGASGRRTHCCSAHPACAREPCFAATGACRCQGCMCGARAAARPGAAAATAAAAGLVAQATAALAARPEWSSWEGLSIRWAPWTASLPSLALPLLTQPWFRRPPFAHCAVALERLDSIRPVPADQCRSTSKPSGLEPTHRASLAPRFHTATREHGTRADEKRSQ